VAWLDDRLPFHPKIVGLSARAFEHWIKALCYCSAHTTRGNLDAAVVAMRTPRRVTEELLAAGLWEQHEDGLWVHDWDAHNEKRDRKLVDIRSRDRRRQQLFRDPELRAEIRERDRDFCRYCGREVNWNDRKSIAGATYDHVDPDGENTLENVVVCCRSCNSRKGGRPLGQTGMRLRPVPERSRADQPQELDPDLDPDLAQDQAPSRARAGGRPNDHDHDHDQDHEEQEPAPAPEPSTAVRGAGAGAGDEVDEDPEPSRSEPRRLDPLAELRGLREAT
jgi:5-methylcytosine-specific restriction endonuclease McrA